MIRFKNKKKLPIKFTSRDYDSIKRDLVEIAKRDYSSIYKDFNEASFGSMMLDTVSYIGDILSFYLDYQVNESFLDTAIEYNNVVRAGKERGYKFHSNPSSQGIVTLYILVPASSIGLGPDARYIPTLSKGSQFSSTGGNSFILNEDKDFSNSNNQVLVAEVDDTTGLPTSYAIQTKAKVISGEMSEEVIEVGEFEKFKRVQLSADNIAEIISVYDAEGHEYFEVDYLSQNVIYKMLPNRASSNNVVPYIIKPVVVPRRFVFEQERGNSYLQFGYGSQDQIKENVVEDPSNVVLKIHGKEYVSDESFDPSILMETDKFGVCPTNTNLRVIYRKNSGEDVNAATDTVTEVVNSVFKFNDLANLTNAKVQSVINSLECTNEEPITGDVTLPNSLELKRRIFDSYASQNRAVTKEDYLATIYRMPPYFGAIKRANIVQDHDSFKRNLNLYVISENQDGTLVATNDVIKKNLKTWLTKNKMINDTIDILDAVIVNVGIEFEVVGELEENKFDLLSKVTAKLSEFYSRHMEIGESFNISGVYNLLNESDGVVDVTNVKIIRKQGTSYADANFNIDVNISPDGRMIFNDENIIFEIKYPALDIKGSVK